MTRLQISEVGGTWRKKSKGQTKGTSCNLCTPSTSTHRHTTEHTEHLRRIVEWTDTVYIRQTTPTTTHDRPPSNTRTTTRLRVPVGLIPYSFSDQARSIFLGSSMYSLTFTRQSEAKQNHDQSADVRNPHATAENNKRKGEDEAMN